MRLKILPQHVCLNYLSRPARLNNTNNGRPKSSTAKSRQYEDIPFVKGMPLVGTIPDLVAAGGPQYLHRYISKRHADYGPIFREKMSVEELLFINDPAAAREVFRYEGAYPEHLIPEAWLLYLQDTGRKRGIFFMEGDEWKKYRTVLNRHLLRTAPEEEYVQLFDEICEDLVTHWFKQTQVEGYIPNLEEDLYRWSLECLGAVVFGDRLNFLKSTKSESQLSSNNDWKNYIKDTEREEFVTSVQNIFKSTVAIGTVPPKVAFKLNLSSYKNLATSITKSLDIGDCFVNIGIRNHNNQTNKCSKSLLQKLLLQDKIDEQTTSRLIIDLLLAAVDTTSHSNTWLLYVLGKHPEIRNNIRNAVIQARDSSKNHDEINRPLLEHPYLKGVIKEVIRLYPIAPFITRRLAVDTTLLEYQVPAKTMAILSVFSMGRDPKHFGCPEQIIPERWMRDQKEDSSKRFLPHTPTAYIPWGVGARSCIGRRIAETMMSTLVVRLLTSHDVVTLNNVEPILKLVTVPNEKIHLKIVSAT